MVRRRTARLAAGGAGRHRGGSGAAGGSRRTRIALFAGAGVAVLVVAGVAIGTLGAARPAGHATDVSDGHSSGGQASPAPPLQVDSVTQGGAVTRTDGASPIRVTLSSPLASNSPMPAVHPAVPGHLGEGGQHADLHPVHPVLAGQPGPGHHPGRRIRAPVRRRRPGGQDRDRAAHHPALVHAAAQADAGPDGLPAAQVGAAGRHRDGAGQRRHRAVRHVLAAAGDLHLEEGLPVHPDQLLGRPVQPDHAGGHPGLPVQRGPDHDRRDDPGPVAGCGPGRRGRQAQPQRLHLRAGQQGDARRR